MDTITTSSVSHENDAAVYIIDDDDATRQSVRTLLQTMGYAVREYPTAEAFLASNDARASGCVLTDMRLSGMSGLELVEKLSTEPYPIPVILFTAFAKTPLTVRAMRRGAINVLDKPLDEDQLWEAVRDAFRIDRRRRDLRRERIVLEERFPTSDGPGGEDSRYDRARADQSANCRFVGREHPND